MTHSGLVVWARHRYTRQVATRLHDTWRFKRRVVERVDGGLSFQPHEKESTGGLMVDIANVKFADLPERHQYSYIMTAVVACNCVYEAVAWSGWGPARALVVIACLKAACPSWVARVLLSSVRPGLWSGVGRRLGFGHMPATARRMARAVWKGGRSAAEGAMGQIEQGRPAARPSDGVDDRRSFH